MYLDFRKAFDLVDHEVMLLKMKGYGFPHNFINWLSDYLTNRTLNVNINGTLSDPFVAGSGVPQGSYLGPILFLIFIDDIVKFIKISQILLFADDIKLFNKIDNYADHVHLQSDLKNITKWCSLNKLNLNFNKCFPISFGRSISFNFEYQITDAVVCQKTDAITDLGVIMDQKLNFNDHISSVVSKANRSWGLIQRHSGSFNLNTTRMLYFSFVKSIVMFASNIWCPVFNSSMKRLERVNHRAVRYLARKSGTPMDKYDHDYTSMAK